MARERKYANLPDMDDAPDIYETPELADDASTVPTTLGRTASDDELYELNDDAQGISRSRLRISEARARFLPTSINASGVDFSDRVDGKRKSYKASSRRQKILQDGTRELGDLSDDDDEESLGRRIARLKREVEEAKEEYAKRTTSSTSTDSAVLGAENLESLSKALEEMSKPPSTTATAQTAAVTKPINTDDTTDATADAITDVTADVKPEGVSAGKDATYTITYTPTYEQSHALAKTADFDRRLLTLEKGLGINSSSLPESDPSGLARAILPTLSSLEKQVSTLSQATTANLDSISRRVRNLASEQEKLNESREKAKQLREELGKHTAAPVSEDSEQDAKVNALYGILPSIESLRPILPPLLDRLRSLRAIHADAASASETLDRIESQQVEMAAELKQWRSGLEKMEVAMADGDRTVEGNMEVMEGWVKDLEERMVKLT